VKYNPKITLFDYMGQSVSAYLIHTPRRS